MAPSLEALRVHCLRQMLRPIAAFCLRNGLALQDLIESLKVVLVQAAEAELTRASSKVNTSRISIMTGVHRLEVGRIRESGGDLTTDKNFIRRVIGLWREGEEFTTSAGKPRVLSFDGEGSDFWHLVQTVSLDPNPAAILRELKRTGAVKESPRGLRLVAGFQMLKGNPEEGYRQLGADMQSLIDTVHDNTERDDAVPHLHLRTDFDNIFVKDLPKIRKWLLREGTLFHKKVRHFLAQHDQDMTPSPEKEAGARVSVTAYSVTDQLPE